MLQQYRVKVLPHPQKVYKGGEDAYFADKKYVYIRDFSIDIYNKLMKTYNNTWRYNDKFLKHFIST